jgi:hypothetical protein
VTGEKRDRGWFGPSAAVGWLLALALMTIGGFTAWTGLGVGLCEDVGSPGSEAYCNHGGWEASGLAIAVLVVVAVIVPTAGVVVGKRRLFWIGLLSPPALAVLVVMLSAKLGADH